MPRGFGIFSSFAHNVAGSLLQTFVFCLGQSNLLGGDPWDGLTAEKLISTMHPKMQKLLKTMPDVRRDYVRELDTALVESRSLSSSDDIKMLREQIEGAIKARCWCCGQDI
eukprot:g31934.t1